MAGSAVAGELAVEVSGLTKSFRSVPVIRGVDLRVPRGCAFGYLGPNGAGKTTLIRVLLGLTRADGGTVRILGRTVPHEREVALARVGAIVDEPRFHPYLTGRQNLDVIAAARGRGSDRRIDATLERVGLAQRARDTVARYSLGMRQRLGIAACLLGDPELLILDEPMNGLDPAGMLDIRNLVRALVAEGRTVVLSSHLLDEVEKTCDSVAIVDRGAIVAQGSIDEVIRGPGEDVGFGCDDPARAATVVTTVDGVASARVEGGSVVVTVARERDGETVRAAVNRALVEAGVAVHSIVTARASLEERFLQITSRLGS